MRKSGVSRETQVVNSAGNHSRERAASQHHQLQIIVHEVHVVLAVDADGVKSRRHRGAWGGSIAKDRWRDTSGRSRSITSGTSAEGTP